MRQPRVPGGEFAKMILAARMAKYPSRRKASKDIGISDMMLTLVEDGGAEPSDRILARLIRYLDLDAEKAFNLRAEQRKMRQEMEIRIKASTT